MTAIWDVDANFKREEKIRLLEDTLIKHEHIVQALRPATRRPLRPPCSPILSPANTPSPKAL